MNARGHAVDVGGSDIRSEMNSRAELPLEPPWGETTPYGRKLIDNVLKQYPHGKAPLTSVSLCKAWLLSNEPENSDRSRRLDGIEIDAADETWSLNGEPKGDFIALCCWAHGYNVTASREKMFSAFIRIWYTEGVRKSRRAVWRAKAGQLKAASPRLGTPKSKPRSCPDTDKSSAPVPTSAILPLSKRASSPSRFTPPPRFGVKLCIQWLREFTLAASGQEDCRLEQVQVRADDKHWSAPEMATGDMKALVKWITRWSTKEEHEAVRQHARSWLEKLAATTGKNVNPTAEAVQHQEGESHE